MTKIYLKFDKITQYYTYIYIYIFIRYVTKELVIFQIKYNNIDQLCITYMLTYLRIYVISLTTSNFIETGLYLTHPLQRFHRKNNHGYRKCLYVTSRSCRAFLFSDWSSLRNREQCGKTCNLTAYVVVR